MNADEDGTGCSALDTVKDVYAVSNEEEFEVEDRGLIVSLERDEAEWMVCKATCIPSGAGHFKTSSHGNLSTMSDWLCADIENGMNGKIFYSIRYVYRLQGDYPKAMESYEISLPIQLLNLGEFHKDVARTYYAIGLVYWKLGNYSMDGGTVS